MTTYEHLNLTTSEPPRLLRRPCADLLRHPRHGERRARPTPSAHEQVMTDSERKHEESMASLRELIDGQAEAFCFGPAQTH